MLKSIYNYLYPYTKKVKPEDNISQDDNMTVTYIRCLFHDFRGPLNNISLGIDIIKETMDETSENYEVINNIRDSCLFLKNALDGFLNIKNVANNNDEFINITYEPFNIVGVIKKIQYLILFNMLNKKIEIIYNISNNIYEWVLGDAINLQHVLLNLLSNAIKYSDKPGKIIIDVKSKEHNKIQNIVISIIDYNKPIKPEIKKKLFEKYNTTDSHGTGLGLFISKKIIELHNGKIYHIYNTLSNGEIIGNIFVIEIPLKICYSSEKFRSSKELSIETSKKVNYTPKNSYTHPFPADVDSPPYNHIYHEVMNRRIKSDSTDIQIPKQIITNKKLKCYVVDDSDISRKMIKRVLSLKHDIVVFDIYESFDGVDIISKIHNNINEIDIIFIDNVMPNLSGSLSTKILRGLGYKNIIIGVTGNGLNEDINEFYDNGADHIFVKPFSKDKIDMICDFVRYNDCISIPNKKLKINSNNILYWSDEG